MHAKDIKRGLLVSIIKQLARAGRQGVAISFCDPHDDTLLLAVEKAINYKIPVDDSHPYHSRDDIRLLRRNYQVQE